MGDSANVTGVQGRAWSRLTQGLFNRRVATKQKDGHRGTMRQAIDIFSYGLTQLFGNFGTALRLTGLVWILASLLVYVLGYALIGAPIGAMAIRPDVEGQMPELSATFTTLSLVINLLAVAWVSLIWSRYCLGADTPSGVIPSLKGVPFGGFLMTLILVVASVGAAAFVLSSLGSLALPYIPFLVGIFVYPIIGACIVIWLFLKIGAALPAAAAGQVLSLAQAWSGSRDNGLWLLAILAVVFVTLLSVPAAMLSGLLIPSNIANVVISWIIVMVGTGWLVAIFRLIPPVPK
ncbi:hypothetical protein BCF46_3158 [Litoreibacter meonggei]|uniref:Uncharacterized protein n=1 Tax=Litoreibacter meonggei TaxID=1049199 RepID=A0A497VMD3_9RHOB|nr:hypothetical protein [Litoreibacter meonggei]RLJ41365.1 hypothetical protein BCF46_3158 [Litoreibacter meonggei]